MRKHILITGGTGEVGSFAALFMARMGIADRITLAARHTGKLSTVRYNAQTSATMRGFDTLVDVVQMDITNVDETAEKLNALKPDLIINCATGMSLYPFFPSMHKRQKRMGIISGFAFTLPKDLLILYPLMKAVKSVSQELVVVNLTAPDLAGPILYDMGLAPQIGAGTLDSTTQGIKLAVAKHLQVVPGRVTVRMVAHHALRRFPAQEVPFILHLYLDGQDITDQFSESELYNFVNFATDVTGVEMQNGRVTNNASITAASAVESAYWILRNEGQVRHGSGVLGMPGSIPNRLYRDRIEPELPDGVSFEDAKRINLVGMHKDGLDHVNAGGISVFTEEECYWLREGLGLDWTQCSPEDASEKCEELRQALIRMDLEEKTGG